MATVKNQNQNKHKIIVLGTVAIILMVFIGVFLFNYINALRTDNSQKNLATEIAYVGQGLLRSSGTVLEKYNEESYRQIADGRNKLGAAIDILSKGGVLSNGVEVPAPSEYLSGQIMSFQSIVGDIITNINFIINEKNDTIILRDKKDKYERLNNKLLESMSYLAANANNLKIANGGQTGSLISIVGKIYNQLNNPNVKYFADDKNILNDNYLSEQNNVLQIINQQVNEISRLPEIIRTFNMPVNERDNLLNDVNKIYSIAQEMKQESNAMMEVLPKIVAAKKYAAQTDKLAVRLEDAYTSLSFSLSSTQNNSNVWLILFGLFCAALVLVVLSLINLASKTSHVNADNRVERKFREYNKNVNSLLSSFLYDGKLRKNIEIKASGFSTGDKMSNTAPLMREIANSITTEKKDMNGLLKEFQFDTLNLIENIENNVNHDVEITKKIDIILPLLDEVKLTMSSIEQSSKNINVDGTKTNIEYSNERMSETINTFNRLKETMQETNKVIKKVSETSQSMNDSLEDIRQYADKMQINALNTEVVTDVIYAKTLDADLLEKVNQINSYIKNVREISTLIIQSLLKIESANFTTSKDTGNAIRSLEENIQSIVEGGESISKIQSSLNLISDDLKIISQYSNNIAEKTNDSMQQLDLSNKEFKEAKNKNRESIEDKSKILLKVKTLNEKINEKIE